MDPIIAEELMQEDQTEFHKRLLTHCKGLIGMSRQKMKGYYAKWDRYDEVYSGYRTPDKQDAKASERGEPEKMVVPLSYAQVQTFVAFCMALFYQRDRLFELIGVSPEDHLPAKIGEAVLERDLTHNTMPTRMYQFLLDTGRFGLGVMKVGWTREVQQMRVRVEEPGLSFFGLTLRKGQQREEVQKVTKYLGNRILNVSPYRFFPDTRLPIERYQEGEFVASEDTITDIELKRLEQQGEVAGTKWVKPMVHQTFTESGRRMEVETSGNPDISSSGATKGIHVLTECEVTLIPADFEVGDGKKLGEETYPVKYNVWYVNDQRVVKCEPLGYLHDQYTYIAAQYSPDLHNLLNEGICGNIDQLQNVVTWLINSHITAVRKTIQNWLVVDPAAVEMDDLTNRRPVIRLKKDRALQGVDRFIKQLEVTDVTTTHMTDAAAMQGMVQLVTGISENALGQFHKGRRSATEAREVNSATAARLKLVALLIFKNALEPLGRQMLSNLRDGLDEETMVRLIGLEADPATYQEFKKVSKRDLVGNYDFEVFNGTMPSERIFQSQALQELVMALFQAPEAIPMLGYDPRLLVKEVLELRGIRYPERFQLSEGRMASMMAEMKFMMETRNATDSVKNGAAGQPARSNGQPGRSMAI